MKTRTVAGIIEIADKNGKSRKRRRFIARLPSRARKIALLILIMTLAGTVVFIRKRQLIKRVLSTIYRLISQLFSVAIVPGQLKVKN